MESSEKDPNAVALGKKGGEKIAERGPEYFADLQAKRKKKAGGRPKNPPKAAYEGEIRIGDLVIPCAVLEDGTRVLSERGFAGSLDLYRSGRVHNEAQDGGAVLPYFLAFPKLKPFISNDLSSALLEPIWYQPKDTGAKAKGTNAQLITDICEVWLKARDAGVLGGARQRRVAERAEILIRGLARVGITALVDEATGYQAIRDKRALQEILDKYLRNELAAWAKRFPDEFYRQLFRLRGWKWKGMKVNKPQIVGHYTNDLVYERLAPGILEELQSRNPKNERGHRKGKHHQLLTRDVGHPALQQHLGALLGLMRISQSWRQFKRLVDTALPKKGDTLLLPFDLNEME